MIKKFTRIRVVLAAIGIAVAGLSVTCSRGPKCMGEDENIGIIKELVVINCMPQGNGKKFIINSDSSFKALFDTSCSLPAIDFNTNTLLGLYTSGGCRLKFIREAERKSDGGVNYQVTVKSCGMCKKLSLSYNWVTVPKIDNESLVTFEVKKK